MKFDICIVGSGAGGSPIAYELSNAGYKVIVLEKGSNYKEEDFSKDEIAVSRRSLFTPLLKDEQHVINDREKDGSVTRYVGSEYNWNFWNGSMVGGSSNLMSGYFHRMKPNDFRLRSKFGEIDGANVVDWPISYEDLEPYYTKVEEIIGVSGDAKKHKFLEPRSTKNFPYPMLEVNGATKWFDHTCRRLGYESIPTPRAVLPHNALGRNGCSYSNFCGSYGCATGAKGSARAALLQKCSAKIVTDAFVYKLDSNKSKITKAHYYDKNLKSHTVEAKIFVVAAQAIETSRLLLNSKNVYFPKGLANNSGEVGKNLIFSAGGSGTGRIRFESLTAEQRKELMEPGLFFNRSLQDWYEYEHREKKYKGGTIDFLFEHANIISRASREMYGDNGHLLWGRELQEKIHKNLTTSRVLTFEVFNDWLPTDYCNVTIDDKVKDKYGVKVGAINLYSHPRDIEVGEYLAKKAKIVLQMMGAEDISVNISASPPPNLVAGGCRFGINPKTSVLDLNCKAHELNNLYVTDASFMPTGGSVPYTWTIYANSFRVADAILGSLEG
ncbi:GMC family oxidoreductase [Candidatus Sulfurimonas marisnigri]|uniref:GMC family oxidoreductase n=1 Tax=Candidatus Sulfurimonas marisnigri TaxID=2740405 RepID=A0A7S7M0B9_9BACT|nr:GMC family oxidoreductase [Candidatus Sulfurimonas marisnigri]QOY54773.1 GMC family oxidoreductase [Candidatus Sulfurimonas marisnigri]